MKKNIILFALGIALLTGCSSKVAEVDGGATKIKFPGSLSKTGPVVVEVNGNKINQAQIKFYIDNLKTELSGDDTVVAAIDRAAEDRVALDLADKKDIELSEKEEESVKKTIYSFRLSMGGVSAYNQYLKDTGLKEDFIEDILEAKLIKGKLKEEASIEITDDEKKQYFKENYYRAKHILLTTQGVDDTKKAEIKAKADDLMARAQGGENFDALVAEFSEDPGSATNPDGYFFTAGEMVAPFENAVKECEIGKITMCESDYGYHIILRLALDETQEMFDREYANLSSTLGNKLIDSKFSTTLMEMAESEGIKVKFNETNCAKVKEALASATPCPMPYSAQR